MNRRSNRTIFASLASLAIVGGASAQVAIDWFTIDGGGGRSQNGCVVIEGSIGQWDAAAPISGGTLNVQPGYWNNTIIPPGCPGDLNGDGQRNTQDLVTFLGRFGQPATACSTGDFNGDSAVNTIDLTFFLGRFGNACP
ncbi:MAG: GC-type dockerin domain-anchored protein [Phycisphaerales bacterium]